MLLKPKTLSLLIIFAAVGILIFHAVPASAQIIGLTNKPIVEIIRSGIDWLLSIAAGLTILFLIIGGIYYVTAAGDDQQMTTAKTMITYAVIGLIFIIISYSIVLTIDKIINP